MSKTVEKLSALQAVENEPNLVLDRKHKENISFIAMKASNKIKVPEKIMFSPDEREKKMIEDAQQKLGLKKSQDILSMALKSFAEKLELAS